MYIVCKHRLINSFSRKHNQFEISFFKKQIKNLNFLCMDLTSFNVRIKRKKNTLFLNNLILNLAYKLMFKSVLYQGLSII